ncbi:MAG TPA: LysM peptidoglycan-binding domain-containing protein [Deltaproteobacteria bacterium]|nr:LysM peptidoglycan-binding domain-containing protein [Deltaproteobacteria bacterium]
MERLMTCLALFATAVSTAAWAQGITRYTVREGDSYARITGLYLPLTDAYTNRELIEEIMRINGMDSRALSVGKALKEEGAHL